MPTANDTVFRIFQEGRLFFWAPKSLQMVTAAMKLKDAYSLVKNSWAGSFYKYIHLAANTKKPRCLHFTPPCLQLIHNRMRFLDPTHLNFNLLTCYNYTHGN